MPGRGEFDMEPENEADHLVKDMNFNDPKDPDEDFKLVIAEIYNDRLDQRSEKKAVVFERGLIDFRRWNNVEKKRGKEEKEAMSKLRGFSRVMSKEDYHLLEQSITAEIQTRARIAQLQEWRKMGVQTLHQGLVYEREKQHRLSQRLMGTAATIQVPVLNPLTSHAANLTWSTTKQRAAPKPDVASMPDAHLLTLPEQSLCGNLQVQPRQYLHVKNLFVTECLKANGLSKNAALHLIGSEDGKGPGAFLWDFFNKAGWIWLPLEED
jgi:transcriptional adapter 2-alpha